MRLGVFGNFTDVKAPNLLLTDPDTGQPVHLNFKTQTYDVDFSQLERPGRQEHPDLRRQLPPQQLRHHPHPRTAEDRNEFGAYFQEEYFTDHFRASVGVRADKFGNLDDCGLLAPHQPDVQARGAPLHPRSPTTAPSARPRWSTTTSTRTSSPPPAGSSTWRPLGRRAASSAAAPHPPGALPAPRTREASGATPVPLKQESLDAYELAYTGSVGNTTFGIAALPEPVRTTTSTS